MDVLSQGIYIMVYIMLNIQLYIIIQNTLQSILNYNKYYYTNYHIYNK